MRYEISKRLHDKFFRLIVTVPEILPLWVKQRLREYSIANRPERTKGVWSSL